MKDSTHEELAFEYANEGLEALYDRKLNKAALSIARGYSLCASRVRKTPRAKNL